MLTDFILCTNNVMMWADYKAAGSGWSTLEHNELIKPSQELLHSALICYICSAERHTVYTCLQRLWGPRWTYIFRPSSSSSSILSVCLLCSPHTSSIFLPHSLWLVSVWMGSTLNCFAVRAYVSIYYYIILYILYRINKFKLNSLCCKKKKEKMLNTYRCTHLK